MKRLEDPFLPLDAELPADDFARLSRREVSTPAASLRAPVHAASVCQLHGFDILDQPLLASLTFCPGQILTARTTVPLRRGMVGSEVVVMFEAGDLQLPIIIGVIEKRGLAEGAPMSEPGASVHADGQRHVIEAEREIVLRCGDASITLTRAGKVIIKGNYILSRSTGYNKIKGAAIDIN